MIGMEQFGLKMWIKCKTVIQVDHSASSFLHRVQRSLHRVLLCVLLHILTCARYRWVCGVVLRRSARQYILFTIIKLQGMKATLNESFDVTRNILVTEVMSRDGVALRQREEPQKACAGWRSFWNVSKQSANYVNSRGYLARLSPAQLRKWGSVRCRLVRLIQWRKKQGSAKVTRKVIW